jgi:hypothetical protein
MSLDESIQRITVAVEKKSVLVERLRIVKLITDNREAPEGVNYIPWIITLILESGQNE